MRRKTFDLILTAGGGMLLVVLLVAGVFLTISANFANSQVRSQLAGQQLLTGAQAKVYADNFIAVHLSEMPYGGVYSKASAALQKDPTNAKPAAAIVAWVLAGVMLVLTILGFWHYRKVSADEEFPASLKEALV